MSDTPLPFDPVSTSQTLGMIHRPVGTLLEIQEAGLDPDLVGCCHRSDPSNGVRGCYVEKGCPFRREGVGGYRSDPNGPLQGKGSTNFKGKGPRMVGYRLRTDRAEGGRTVENQVTCYGFTSVLLQRMLKGNADRDAGKRDYEAIRIIAMEGEPIIQKKIVAVNPVGAVAGTDIREKALKPEPQPVTRILRPGEISDGRYTAVTYDQIMRQREAESQRFDDALDLVSDAEIKRLMLEAAESDDDLSPALQRAPEEMGGEESTGAGATEGADASGLPPPDPSRKAVAEPLFGRGSRGGNKPA